jgi:hypothetical protein
MSPTGDDAALSRRNLLLGGVGLALSAVSGCAISATPATAPSNHSPSVSDSSHDAAAAVRIGSAAVGAAGVIGAVLARFPGLTHRLDGLVAMHQVHLMTLRAAVPGYHETATASPTPIIPTKSGAALQLVLSTERTLHDELIATAVAARNGRYARLFGSMSAAISQQLAAMPG